MPSGPSLPTIAARLQQCYGVRVPSPRSENPLHALIRTLLSQNTTAANSARAYASLRRSFPAWADVRRASVREVASALRPGGLADIKAVWIKAILEEIWEQQGHFNLSFLRDLSDAEAAAYLGRFRGIGAKTVACVLLFGLGRSAFPVDTHVFRVCRRLGLLNGVRTPERAQALLANRAPAESCYALHLHLVEHGRRVCTARRPDCGACVLGRLCAYARRAGGATA
jgi:endonuclease III